MIAAIASLLIAAMAPSQAEAASPVSDFLRAADVDDKPAMEALLSKSAGLSFKKLSKQLDGCYLRRVYGTEGGGVLATWMCADGAKRSRVLIADVARAGDGVAVQIVNEQFNQRPAPPRSGSALASDQ